MSKNRKTLKKFTKLEWLDDILRHGLFLADLKCLNDPYEYKSIKNANRYKVCSLSSSRYSMYMMSHYADGGKGCVVEIERPDAAMEVKYMKASDIRNLTASVSPEAALTMKGTTWSVENEWRLIYDRNDGFGYIDVNGKVFKEVSIKRITFGSEVTTEEILKYLDDIKAKKIEIKKLKLSDTKFQYLIDQDFKI
ncbi:MAG: hypothetical protein K6D02_03650 [Lachnospiraceae bacterium]|nr:hypothetical protein [Lachnospiraceae bacterium]